MYSLIIPYTLRTPERNSAGRIFRFAPMGRALYSGGRVGTIVETDRHTTGGEGNSKMGVP